MSVAFHVGVSTLDTSLMTRWGPDSHDSIEHTKGSWGNETMNIIAMIPARYASTRLPGKPLLAETGKPMIQHVVEAVRQADVLDEIIVATDDTRIADAVESFGTRAVMTNEDCKSGTDRLAEAAEILGLDDEDIILNVQGDEPDMPPACLELLVNLLESSGFEMATLATPMTSEMADDPNKVKVVLDRGGRAMYFSRAKIPFDRDNTGSAEYLLHLGIYGYRVGFLKRYNAMESTAAEKVEKLEQLRALENGCSIIVGTVDYDGHGIDTPEDYAAFVARYNS